MLMTIAEIQQEIVTEFSVMEDWMQKYEYLIDLGKQIPLIEESAKIDANLIKGCQSKVWLDAHWENGKMYYKADSDAILTKGIVSLLIRVFDGQPSESIRNANMDFLNEIGLQQHLSPTRANGLFSMIKQMKFYAVAYQAKYQN